MGNLLSAHNRPISKPLSSIGENRMNHSRIHLFSMGTLVSLAIGACLFSGCLFDGDPVSPEILDKPVQISACADLAPAQKASADSLVELANAKMTVDMEYMFSDSVNEWKDIQGRGPKAALNLYDQALKVAPGHCGATFGRAVAATMMTTQDPKFDNFVTKVEQASDNPPNQSMMKVNSGMGLLKLAPDQAAPVLMKLNADMKKMDYPTVSEFQDLVESTLMPKVDSAIAALEETLKFENFTFEFTTEERGLIQLDHGEIGPLLAGLKVVKAWLTVAAGYQWELAINGKYSWMDTLENLDEMDFDHLRPGQIAALDQVTGLFKTTSPFSRVKPTWKSRINGIPALLLSAIDNAQKGLRYAIKESQKPTGQENDLYVVGLGPDADVDPADLQEAVDLLERGKKYLSGEVNIKYNYNSKSLSVNFRKLFEVDGIQSMLPYFQFRPYKEWNDTLSADTYWNSQMSSTVQKDLLGKIGYDLENDHFISLNGLGGFGLALGFEVIAHDGYDSLTDTYNSKVIATLSANPNNLCEYSFEKTFDRVLKPGSTITQMDTGFIYISPYTSVAKTSTGSVTLKSCREKVNGVEYAEYYNVKTKAPFYFTNPAGTLTLDLTDVEKYEDDLSALQNKIIFRDPTFGGIFPELTQATIWEVVNSMKTVEPRAKRICEDVFNPDGSYGYTCHTVKVTDPSDLDLLISFGNWMDGPL
jgi:hypothetical protein